ncbi:crotonase/enoyl-CoA hydratase family protein [Sulfitobacter albidus]|uniref:Crotonase/enoyl-CoA hydratase family protein n=1 Tax=Sulfitobacter albidus TaxID=2829501 RepID=A0A975PNS1_9RHOB|nr:crotonase/enoyl-CoA hydratase family protein [Sulfitobacter albidus]QUJ78152.1 crotonase/enoyl-CoA hydratase family protein [Sulfitobacter albidus]
MIFVEIQDNIAFVQMDDAKLNVVNPAFIQGMNAALDEADAAKAKAVVLAGRGGVFSAGFDLREFSKGADATRAQVLGGFDLLLRLMAHPRPTIAACTGHGIGMGAFLLMVCDYRVGAEGDFKFSMPESRIGLDLGAFLIAIAQSRITPKYLTRMAVLSEELDIAQAREAGLLDETGAADTVVELAMAHAKTFAAMPAVFSKNKREIKATTLAHMRDALADLKSA